jgi:hypothetical protein
MCGDAVAHDLGDGFYGFGEGFHYAVASASLPHPSKPSIKRRLNMSNRRPAVTRRTIS